MVLGNKHFDDLDDFSAFDEKLECGDDSEASEPGPNSALAWRKPLIEKAVLNVRKASELKIDINSLYPQGTLLFDDESHRFARVLESRPGFLNLAFVSGGKLIKQSVNKLDFVRKNRVKLTLQEMAEELCISEVQVIGLLNQIEMEQEKQAASLKPKIIASVKTAVKKPIVSVLAPKPAAVKQITPTKVPMKIAAKKPGVSKKSKISLAPAKDNSVSFTKLLPKGATTDPVRDPNGYIQQNFLLMSNKELAVATGLSEHTVRRKLGEWGLKRKNFVMNE